MIYELNEIGEVVVSYDEDLETYSVELLDSETFHHMDYEDMTEDELYDAFPESMADEIINDCKDGKEHRYEPLAYMNDEIDLNDRKALDNYAKKVMKWTTDYQKGMRGFILSDGTIVQTPSEHNECTKITGVKSTFHFIQLGNIRLLDHSIDIAKRPTTEQYKTLTDVLDSHYDDELYIDLEAPNKKTVSLHYTDTDPDEAMHSIRNYFNNLNEDRKTIIINESLIKAINEAINK